MPVVPLVQCKGIDTRKEWGEDDFVLSAGVNVQVRPGGYLDTRPALVHVADVDALSVGLYSRGGALRCVVPSGLSLQDGAPAGFIYDGIGDGVSTAYSGKLASVAVAETFGVDAVAGPNGYLAIERSDTGQIEHHYVQAPPDSAATYVATKVALPFVPGRGMVKHVNKVFATDPANGVLRYCSSVNGPTDWTTAADAGFEDAAQFISGQRDMIALGVHRGLLAIFYADALQLWEVFTDPANNDLKQILNGPGMEHALGYANVLGDAYFLSRNGFSNLNTALYTAEAKYADIGSPILSLTKGIAATDPVVTLWSQRRGQFLAAQGSTVYVYGFYPAWNESAWTTWTLPVSVDALCELDGDVYVRSGTAVYKLDDSVGTDSNGTAIAWSFITQPLGFGANGRNKALKRLTAQCSGAATYTPIVDGRTLAPCAVRLPGSSGPMAAMLLARGRRIAVAVAGSGRMSFHGMELSADLAGP